MGLAQADQHGNLNVSKFGSKLTGPGGFIDITQNSKCVVFLGTFTTGDLEITVQDGRLKILKEGRIKKFVEQVEEITFSGKYAKDKSQKVLYITERCVLELTEKGMTLIEIAPGTDLERDILKQMEFEPMIDADLKVMDMRIFQESAMGLGDHFDSRQQ